YDEEGAYPVAVEVTKLSNRANDSAAATANVGDADLTAAGQDQAATEGVAFSQVVATFTDANPRATPDEFSVTIDWGDGRTSGGRVRPDGHGGFEVLGDHTYDEEGSYPVHVEITDTGGGSFAAADSMVTVGDADLKGTGLDLRATVGVPLQ